MKVFGAYSKYYNLLYKDKDYTGEAEYVHHLIQDSSPGAKSILDLGCGTGRHDLLLAQSGYSVTGVDQSEEMLNMAQSLRATPECRGDVNFCQGDIRNVRLDKRFDVIVSLFHVMSYQTTNEDIKAAFKTAKVHLTPGGVFIFDFWYGPAVLSERPEVRVKRLEDEMIEVTRIAEPKMYANDNCVDVNYQIIIRDKSSGRVDFVTESHRMRYLFAPEIREFLSANRMKCIGLYEFLTDDDPGLDTWSVCCVGQIE